MKTDTRTTDPYSRCLEAISLLREGNVINFQHSHSIKPVAPVEILPATILEALEAKQGIFNRHLWAHNEKR
jgi:hypothetical protein